LNGDINFLRPDVDEQTSFVLSGLMGAVQGMAMVGETIFAGGTNDKVPKVVAYQAGVGGIARVEGDGPTPSITGMASCGTDLLTLDMEGKLCIANCEDPTHSAFTATIADLEIPTKDVDAGTDLVVCASEHSITVHRKSAGYAVLSKLEDLGYAPLKVAVSPEENIVAVSSAEARREAKKIVLYNVGEDNTLTPFKELIHQGAVYALSFSPDGRYLGAGDGNREVRVYDCSNDYECLREGLQYNSGRVTCLAWHPDSDMLISGDIGRTVVVTHIGKLLNPTITRTPITKSGISTARFINADTFALGDVSGAVTVCDFKKL